MVLNVRIPMTCVIADNVFLAAIWKASVVWARPVTIWAFASIPFVPTWCVPTTESASKAPALTHVRELRAPVTKIVTPVDASIPVATSIVDRVRFARTALVSRVVKMTPNAPVKFVTLNPVGASMRPAWDFNVMRATSALRTADVWMVVKGWCALINRFAAMANVFRMVHHHSLTRVLAAIAEPMLTAARPLGDRTADVRAVWRRANPIRLSLWC